MKKLFIFLLFLLAPLARAQQTTVTATVTDSNSTPYSFGTGSGTLVCPGNQQPTFHGFTVPRTITITGLDGTGTFTQKFYDVNLIDQTGCGYRFSITDQTTAFSFSTSVLTTVTGSSVNLSASISSFAAILPVRGTVAVSGSPASGNLAKWAGGAFLTNGDLSGDVTTSGTLATTLATVATPGTNTKVTFNAKGLVTSAAAAQLASADFANQGTTTTVLHGNAAGNPSFSKVDLTNDTTSTLPVGSMAPGTNGQCINTAGGVAVWGSCAGTAGEQFLSVNTTPVTVNANTMNGQTMQQAQSAIGAGALNTLTKTIRVTSSGNFTPVNTTESVQIFFSPCGACTNSAFLPPFVPSVTSLYGWSFVLNCTVTATGATGTIVCAGTLNIGGTAAVQNTVAGTTAGVLTYNNVNLTGSLTPQNSISFTTASASNSGTSSYFLVEQLN